MKLTSWIENNRGIDEGNDIPCNVLSDLYHRAIKYPILPVFRITYEGWIMEIDDETEFKRNELCPILRERILNRKILAQVVNGEMRLFKSPPMLQMDHHCLLERVMLSNVHIVNTNTPEKETFASSIWRAFSSTFDLTTTFRLKIGRNIRTFVVDSKQVRDKCVEVIHWNIVRTKLKRFEKYFRN